MSQTSRSRTVLACALLLAPSRPGSPRAAGPPRIRSPRSRTTPPSRWPSAGGRPEQAGPGQAAGRDGQVGARITDVTATDSAGRRVRGELSEDGKHWRSTTPLAAGTHYRVRVSTEKGDGSPGRSTLGFDTASASDKRLRVTFGPATGTYGSASP
ncbi:Ig-like domain-containing protein [Streptomyces sp. M19]